MKTKIKKAIEEYQCSGCVSGYDLTCFEKWNCGVGCEKHHAGTLITGIGRIFLGLPKGFCRLGEFSTMKPYIFEKFEDCDWYDYISPTYKGKKEIKFNIPVWKYVSEESHTFVRGISPRINSPFIHIFLEDCRDKIDCLEITQDDIESMD